MRRPISKTRIGLSTGDVVRTSYGTSGVIVDILGPYGDYGQRPVYSIVYVKPEHAERFRETDLFWINDVCRDEAGIYHCGYHGETVTIKANPDAPTMQASLLDVLEEAGTS